MGCNSIQAFFFYAITCAIWRDKEARLNGFQTSGLSGFDSLRRAVSSAQSFHVAAFGDASENGKVSVELTPDRHWRGRTRVQPRMSGIQRQKGQNGPSNKNGPSPRPVAPTQARQFGAIRQPPGTLR